MSSAESLRDPDHITVRLSKNYNLPLPIARARWNHAKSKATSKDSGTDYVKALEIFHSMRASPLPKSTSPLPIARRGRPSKEVTQWAVPRNTRN